jgi:hypothetical protein
VIQEHRNKSLVELGWREILCNQFENQNWKKKGLEHFVIQEHNKISMGELGWR